MDNISFRMLKDSDQHFIVKYGLYDNIGKPIKLDGNVYYPILFHNLFLRYYISYGGYIYDIVNNDVKKFNLSDDVILINIDRNKKIHNIQELIWRTFYRFPEGRMINLDDDKNDIECTHHFEKGTEGFYTINGIEFVYEFDIPEKGHIYEYDYI